MSSTPNDIFADRVIRKIKQRLDTDSIINNKLKIVKIISAYIKSNNFDDEEAVKSIIEAAGPNLRDFMFDTLDIKDKIKAKDPTYPESYGDYSREEVKPELFTQTAIVKKPIENIEVKKILGFDNLRDIQKFFNPSSLYRRSYIILDSDKRLNKDNFTSFKWLYGSSVAPQDGFFNTLDRINNIVSIRLYQPRLPYFANLIGFNQRLSILIEEFQTQSFLSTVDRRFHFIGQAVPNAGLTYVDMFIQDYGDAIFNFAFPIKILESLTISFGNPNTLVTFPSDKRFFLAFEITYMADPVADSQSHNSNPRT